MAVPFIDTKLHCVNWNYDFEGQVESVLDDIGMNALHRNEVNIIEYKLKKAINTVWPDAEISMYGSIATGLGLNCSDIDFSIDQPLLDDTSIYLSTITALLSRTPDFGYPESHEDTKLTSSHPGKRILRKGKRQGPRRIRTNYPVPFVSAVYLPSGRFFDITFNNDRAKATTALITEIMMIDARVIQLMMLVKFWCKFHGMVGRRKLTCMIIYTLVIFYLQEERVLPSVASIIDSENSRYIEGYNVALKSTEFEKTQNKSILELLGGFFEFYNNFPWLVIVVSPFAGRPHERAQFANGGSNLPDIFKDFKSDSTNSLLVAGNTKMVVQNPLFLSENLTASIKYKFFKNFNSKLGEAAMCYRDGWCNNHVTFLRRILVR